MNIPYTVKEELDGKLVVEIECAFCGSIETRVITKEGHAKRQSGHLVQDCFPELTPDEREIFVSAMCNNCWKETFGE